MTTYSSRDLRFAGWFAMLLTGIGLAFVGLRLLVACVPDCGPSSPIHLWLAAIVFLALGKAIGLKVGELQACHGRERNGTPDG